MELWISRLFRDRLLAVNDRSILEFHRLAIVHFGYRRTYRRCQNHQPATCCRNQWPTMERNDWLGFEWTEWQRLR